MRALPVAAVGKTQACFDRRSGCRAPQQGFANANDFNSRRSRHFNFEFCILNFEFSNASCACKRSFIADARFLIFY